MGKKPSELNRRDVVSGLAGIGALASSGALLRGVLAPAVARAEATASDVGVTAESIKIGMTAGITGAISFASQQFSGFMQRLFDHINTAGGVNRRKLRLVILDDGGKGDVALQNAQRLLEQEKVFAVTTIGTATAAGILEYLRQRNVPLLFPAAYNTELTTPVHANTFTLYQSYEGQIAAVTKWACRKMGSGSAVIVRANIPSFDLAVERAAQAIKAAGGSVTATLNTTYNQPEWASTVIRLKEIKPAYLILITTAPDMGRLWKEMTQQRFRPAKATLGISPLGDQAFLDTAGHVPDNATFAAIPGTVVPSSDEAKEARDLWPEQKMGVFGLAGAVSGGMMAEAFRRLGPDLTRAKLIDLLANHFGPYKLPYSGTAKSEPDHLLIHSVSIATVRNGVFVPATHEFVI
ncbi:MAG: ABC transporter substrate-binding protein [Alphaproteobacteria bacterium]|nr:ABC transporter substrate-binding protein [Alphaproteobacteria bacterium]